MRSTFGTRIGFLLALIGSAVGLGNIWKFPYLAGQNGGGYFVLFYLICIFLVAIPLLIAEMSVGKGSNQPPNLALLEITGSKLMGWLGWIPFVTCWIIMSFYSVISGWVLCYLIQSTFALLGYEVNLASYFATLNASPWELLAYHLAIMVINMLILLKGIKNGIERFCLFMMPILGLILIGLFYFAYAKGDMSKSIEFMFAFRGSEFHVDDIRTALGHAFFSIGIGFGIALTYGAYLKKEVPIVRSAIWVGLCDTLIALAMGVVIFSFTEKFGVSPAAGPTLIFDVLPNIFKLMPGGTIVSFLFYLAVFIACLTSSISVMEVMIFTLCGERQESHRTRATIISTVLIALLGVVTVLSMNLWSHIKWWRGTPFDNLDYISSNILLPFFGMLTAIVFVCALFRDPIYQGFIERERLWLPYLKKVLIFLSIPVMTIVLISLALPNELFQRLLRLFS